MTCNSRPSTSSGLSSDFDGTVRSNLTDDFGSTTSSISTVANAKRLAKVQRAASLKSVTFSDSSVDSNNKFEGSNIPVGSFRPQFRSSPVKGSIKQQISGEGTDGPIAAITQRLDRLEDMATELLSSVQDMKLLVRQLSNNEGNTSNGHK